ncbi:MAG: protein kinase, partial [Planctomycetes bacterium]|nr:protein kinase [Planctomycetota bacterium]
MISPRNVKVVSLQLNNGFSGRAMLLSKSDNVFSKADWLDCLSRPQSLFEETEKILKTQGRNCVAVKKLTIDSKQIKVVIKRHRSGKGLRNFFRSLQPGKAIRNFKTAVKLISREIPTAMPLAAIHRKENFLTKESIYITEYFENSCSLYDFANEKTNFKSRRQICRQVATLLASLCKNGLWHRDAKASNFLVCKDNENQCRVVLVDMDGIKRNIFRKERNQLRCLWQLAASVMNVHGVNRTDYLRVFTAYCDLTGIGHPQQKQLFYKLAKKAKAKFMQKAAANNAASFKNILIIKPSSLGDIVLTLPALSALRRNFPDAKISWLVRPEFEPLIKNHPHLTNTIIFDRKLLGKWWCNWKSFSCLVSLIRQLRSSRFDAV